jgi:hypothetical protein
VHGDDDRHRPELGQRSGAASEYVLGEGVSEQVASLEPINRHGRIPQLVNTRKAAEILGRSPNTLKRWRYEGVGPAYVEIEGRVSYDVGTLIDYINENTKLPSVRAYMEDTREAL